jgi:leucyl-tRNA synthetase
MYEAALQVENVQKYIEGHEIRKHFVIKGKIVNIVI